MKYCDKLPVHREKRRWLETAWAPYGLVTVCITAVFLLVMIWQDLYPFGDWSLANSDGSNQYLNFYTYFRDTFYSNNDLNYSFSTILGGNMQGLYAYYLASPLYFLLVLFPEEQILLALHFIIYLKLLIAGLCFCAWAGYRKKGNMWMRVALSVCYAFMGYTVTFYNLLSWLDAIALLPLVALGLERLVYERKPLTYVLALAATIMTSYYIGFMVCIAAVLFYGALLLVNTNGVWKTVKGTALIFAFSSILAGALSAWILLPAIRSLPENRVQDAEGVFGTLRENFSLFRVFSKLFTGTTSADEFFAGLPTIFVGVIPLVLVVLFFLNPRIRRRWKAVAAAVLLVLLFSFHHNWLNTIWHGFSKNQMFNYRYSFVFSFILLAVAWHGVCHWKPLSGRTYVYCAVIMALGILLIFGIDYTYGSTKTRCFDLLLVAAGILLAFFAGRNRRLATLALVGLIVLNCLANHGLTVRNIRSKFGSALQSRRTEFIASADAALELIPEDEEFYRIEKTFHQTYCDNMALGIPGVSNFSSVERNDSIIFAQKMGMSRYSVWARFTGENSAAAESLLGIRYILSKEPLRNGREDYALLGTAGEISVYENPYALPLMTASETLMPELEEGDGFLFQNACWESLATGIGQKVFAHAQCREIKDMGDGSTYLLIYEIPQEGSTYLHFPGSYMWKARPFTVELYREEHREAEQVEVSAVQSTYALGEYAQGDQLTMKVTLQPGADLEYLDSFMVYVENADALNEYSRAVQSREVSVQKVTSSHLTVRCTTEEETPYLVSTIPFDEGWEVTVDGDETPIVKNWGCMLAFEVDPGEHVIELRYHPPGKRAGWAITLGAVALPLLYGLFTVVKKRKKK